MPCLWYGALSDVAIRPSVCLSHACHFNTCMHPQATHSSAAAGECAVVSAQHTWRGAADLRHLHGMHPSTCHHQGHIVSLFFWVIPCWQYVALVVVLWSRRRCRRGRL